MRGTSPHSPVLRHQHASPELVLHVVEDIDAEGRIASTPKGLTYAFRSFHDALCDPPGAAAGTMKRVIADCLTVVNLPYPGNFFLPADMPPRCTLERLARAVFDSHTAGVAYDAARSGAEWWMQVTQPGEDIGPHFDKDEDLYVASHKMIHPQVSTVTYLTDGGAPTLIVDTRTKAPFDALRPDPITTAHLSWPTRGKHISFDGRYEHTAAHPLAYHFRSPAERGPRISFLVNVWLHHQPLDIPVFDEALVAKHNLSDLPVPFAIPKTPRPVPTVWLDGRTGGVGVKTFVFPHDRPLSNPALGLWSTLPLPFPPAHDSLTVRYTRPADLHEHAPEGENEG